MFSTKDDPKKNSDKFLTTGATNQGLAYYQECVSLFGKKVFMKPVNECSLLRICLTYTQ